MCATACSLLLSLPPVLPCVPPQPSPAPFLVLSSRQDRDTRQAGKDLRVLERSIFSDRQVFVRAMHRAGTMEDFEVSVYNTM